MAHGRRHRSKQMIEQRIARPGNEPCLEGEAIGNSWHNAWVRCIARIWYEEETHTESQWYRNIFSKDPAKVLKALTEEGFIRDAFGNEVFADDDLERWINADITVKKDDEDVFIGSPDTNKLMTVSKSQPAKNNWKYVNRTARSKNIENGWNGVNGLKHTLVLTVPRKPDNPAMHAVALADLQSAGIVYPFTFCC